MTARTVRLSIQIWDREKQVRMSMHRDVLASQAKDEAGDVIGAMLPAFRDRSAKGRVAAAASVSNGPQLFTMRRPRSAKKRGRK